MCYEDVIDAFRCECSLLLSLGSHPNVVPVLGVVDTGEVLVMEKAATDLSSAIKATNGRLPLPLMRGWVEDILQGVDFIHSNGVIHQVPSPSQPDPALLRPFPSLPFATLEATQGQILSQSLTDATRFWWHLYGS